MTSQSGLDYIIDNQEFTRKLATALDTDNVMVKKQVFELLSALCVYSSEGYARAIDALEQYKVLKKANHRFNLIIEELRASQNSAYKTTLLAFINCIVISTENIKERVRVRNEFSGLKLGAVLNLLGKEQEQDPDLAVQLEVYDDQKANDEELLPGPEGVDLNSHLDVFHAIFKQISDSAHEIPFLATLQHLLQIDRNDPLSTDIWETVEKLVYRATLLEKKEDKDKLLLSGYKKLDRVVQGEGGSPSRGRRDSTNEPTSPREKRAIHPDGAPPSPAPAPPPPPPGMGGPPVPPPPPSGTPGPPPPPGAFKTPTQQPTITLPQQETPTPKSKMKKLQWNKIPAMKVVGKDNIWTKVGHVSNGYKVDFAAMEELFSQPDANVIKEKGDSLDSGNTSRKEKRNTEVNLLDGKRSLNVNIFLKQFRGMSHESIVMILRTGASEEIGVEKLKGLQKILPDSDEIEMLKTYEGDRSKLGNGEKFYMQLLTLPNYHLRVEAMLIKEEFKNNTEWIKPSIDAIIMAAKEIKESIELQEVLYLVLIAGNFLNTGGYAGNAAGFRLISLLKLTEIRANKPRMNLMHYVVMQAQEKNPDLLHLPEKMKYLKEASQSSIESLTSDITTLRDKVLKISQQLGQESDRTFISQMEEFLKNAKEEIYELEQDLADIEYLRLELCDFFCEDAAAFKLEECLKIIQTFCERFKKAIEENIQRKLAEEKAEQRKNMMDLRKRHSSGDLPFSRRCSPLVNPEDTGQIVNALLGDIKSGMTNNVKFADANFSIKPVKMVSLDTNSVTSQGDGSSVASSKSDEFVRHASGRASQRNRNKLRSIFEQTTRENDETSSQGSNEDRSESDFSDRKMRGSFRSRNRKDDTLLNFLTSNGSTDTPALAPQRDEELENQRRKRREGRAHRQSIDSFNERERAPSPQVFPEDKEHDWRKKFSNTAADNTKLHEEDVCTIKATKTPAPSKQKKERRSRSELKPDQVHQALMKFDKQAKDDSQVGVTKTPLAKTNSEPPPTVIVTPTDDGRDKHLRAVPGRQSACNLEPNEIKSALKTIEENGVKVLNGSATNSNKSDCQKPGVRMAAQRFLNSLEQNEINDVIKKLESVDSTGIAAPETNSRVECSENNRSSKTDIDEVVRDIQKAGKEIEQSISVPRRNNFDRKSWLDKRKSAPPNSISLEQTTLDSILADGKNNGLGGIEEVLSASNKDLSKTNGKPQTLPLTPRDTDKDGSSGSLTEKAMFNHLAGKWRENVQDEDTNTELQNHLNINNTINNGTNSPQTKLKCSQSNLEPREIYTAKRLSALKSPTESSDIFTSLHTRREQDTFGGNSITPHTDRRASKIGSSINSRLKSLYPLDDDPEDDIGLSPKNLSFESEEGKKDLDENENKKTCRHSQLKHTKSDNDEGFVSQRGSLSSTLDSDTAARFLQAKNGKHGSFDENEEHSAPTSPLSPISSASGGEPWTTETVETVTMNFNDLPSDLRDSLLQSQNKNSSDVVAAQPKKIELKPGSTKNKNKTLKSKTTSSNTSIQLDSTKKPTKPSPRTSLTTKSSQKSTSNTSIASASSTSTTRSSHDVKPKGSVFSRLSGHKHNKEQSKGEGVFSRLTGKSKSSPKESTVAVPAHTTDVSQIKSTRPVSSVIEQFAENTSPSTALDSEIDGTSPLRRSGSVRVQPVSVDPHDNPFDRMSSTRRSMRISSSRSRDKKFEIGQLDEIKELPRPKKPSSLGISRKLNESSKQSTPSASMTSVKSSSSDTSKTAAKAEKSSIFKRIINPKVKDKSDVRKSELNKANPVLKAEGKKTSSAWK